MKKIISLFQRNYDGDRLVRDEVVPGAEWVLNGEGIPTQKMDGTSCMVKGGELYKRYDCKQGKNPPNGFIPAQDPDPITKHWPGWILCDPYNPGDKWAFEALGDNSLIDGTYELCGPKINGNHEQLESHVLIPHGHNHLLFNGRTFAEIKEYLKNADIEGIVWHHQDGRMVKIKKKDFGFNRKG